ncbi:STAS domain-containing protein [uncultured Streptomyces sp.]|uniref:STAS domain-containing protein n=1 Tax=uncultured Streptomyces sp. TaxID=174707 RepID=UPI00263025C1|nr:STAS domain-containing protein [uncultured Streptomyces sp.]
MTSQPTPFTLTVENGRDTVCLRLTGDLDHHTGDLVVEQAEECLTGRPGLRDLILDCTGMTFCDSIGISSLLMIHRKTTAHSVRLHVEHQPPFLRRLLDITGVQQLFTHPHLSRRAG